MIPKIIKYNISSNTTNIVQNFINDNSYFIHPNEFSLNFIKIGPFSSSKNLNISIVDFMSSKLKFNEKNGKIVKEKNEFYYLLVFSL
jgi:hypothetical protein